jgi:hypothetical protein
MQMGLNEFTVRFPDWSMPVPKEFAGEWLAWNEDRTKILSHGEDLIAVREEAIALGCVRPVLQKVPHAPFVGRA